jgi:hypothetical protein
MPTPPDTINFKDCIPWIISVFSAAIATRSYFHTRKKDRIADERVAKAEAESKASKDKLREIQSRGNAPYLVPSKTLFNMGYYPEKNGTTSGISPLMPNVLCAGTLEVTNMDMGKDPYVVMALANNGKAFRNGSIKTRDLKELDIVNEVEMNGSHGLMFLSYLYEKNKHGKPCTFELSFESLDGFQDTHTYELIHGHFALKRIKPE